MFSAYFTDYISGKKAEPFRALPAGVSYGDPSEVASWAGLKHGTKTAYGTFGVVSKQDIKSLIEESKQLKHDLFSEHKEEEILKSDNMKDIL